jgi:hypothetical protein
MDDDKYDRVRKRTERVERLAEAMVNAACAAGPIPAAELLIAAMRIMELMLQIEPSRTQLCDIVRETMPLLLQSVTEDAARGAIQ